MNEWLKAKDTKILDFAHDKRAELVALQEKLKMLQSKTSKPPATGTSGNQAIPLVTPSTYTTNWGDQKSFGRNT